ncbi:MAG TPA: hypothetical protein VK590_08770 [Saprospiraceae bacterium]|nr:hypothetical protein [Saprospiraceae bacterium]
MQKKEIKARYLGIGLLFATIFVFIIIPILTEDKIIKYLSLSIFGVVKLSLFFFGQTTVRKLNRNYKIWSLFLFFFTSFSLIILGRLNKINKEIIYIDLKTSNKNNPNFLPNLSIYTDSNLIIDSLENDSFTLNHLIHSFKNTIKEYTSIFPVLAAYQLNNRDILFDDDLKKTLDNYSNFIGKESFIKLLDHLKSMTAEEINKFFL